jgi:hypothetical protein
MLKSEVRTVYRASTAPLSAWVLIAIVLVKTVITTYVVGTGLHLGLEGYDLGMSVDLIGASCIVARALPRDPDRDRPELDRWSWAMTVLDTALIGWATYLGTDIVRGSSVGLDRIIVSVSTALTLALFGYSRWMLVDRLDRDSQRLAVVRAPVVIPVGKHDPLVYFMRNGTRIKIGTTTHLHNRVRRLALREADVIFTIPGDQHVEQQLHQQFKQYRVGDTEWFEDKGRLTRFLKTGRDD